MCGLCSGSDVSDGRSDCSNCKERRAKLGLRTESDHGGSRKSGLFGTSDGNPDSFAGSDEHANTDEHTNTNTDEYTNTDKHTDTNTDTDAGRW